MLPAPEVPLPSLPSSAAVLLEVPCNPAGKAKFTASSWKGRVDLHLQGVVALRWNLVGTLGLEQESRDVHSGKVRMLGLHFFQKVKSCGESNHSGMSA